MLTRRKSKKGTQNSFGRPRVRVYSAMTLPIGTLSSIALPTWYRCIGRSTDWGYLSLQLWRTSSVHGIFETLKLDENRQEKGTGSRDKEEEKAEGTRRPAANETTAQFSAEGKMHQSTRSRFRNQAGEPGSTRWAGTRNCACTRLVG